MPGGEDLVVGQVHADAVEQAVAAVSQRVPAAFLEQVGVVLAHRELDVLVPRDWK